MRLASFLIPPLAVLVLLYQAFASLQIALTHRETLIVTGASLAVACVMGAIAAFGGPRLRVGVFALTTVVLLDMTGHTPVVLNQLTPATRVIPGRDHQRVTDLHQIQAALDRYIDAYGPPPRPGDYGEGTGLETFWPGWWDLSTDDRDGDGRPFMSFLADRGLLSDVPVDPVNGGSGDGDPTAGHQYVYYVVPPLYPYEGGVCPAAEGHGIYLLAATAFESERESRPRRLASPGCECLWRDAPDFFAKYFDYVTCGTFPAAGRRP